MALERDYATALEGNAPSNDQILVDLYAAHHVRIYHLAYRITGNSEDARDVTQDTFVRAYRHLGRTDLEGNLGGWLSRIAANCAIDLLRRRKRIQWDSWEELPERADDASEDRPESVALASDNAREIQDILNRLPTHYRSALVLREMEGYSIAEIALILGRSAPSVKSLLFRARERFRAEYVNSGDPPVKSA